MPVDQQFTILANACIMVSFWLVVHRPQYRTVMLWTNVFGSLSWIGAAVCYHNPWMIAGEVYFVVLGLQGLWKLYRPAERKTARE